MLVKVLLKLLHKERCETKFQRIYYTFSATRCQAVGLCWVLNSIRDARCIFVQDDSIALFGLRISIAATRTVIYMKAGDIFFAHRFLSIFRLSFLLFAIVTGFTFINLCFTSFWSGFYSNGKKNKKRRMYVEICIALSVNRTILMVFTHAREVVAVLINEYVVWVFIFCNGTATYMCVQSA